MWNGASGRVPDPIALRTGVRQLMVLRAIATGGQAAAIAAAWYLGVSLPLAGMAVVVAALIALNAFVWLRLRGPRAASRAEIAAYLALDLAAFTVLLFLSGGAANPFSLLFVLHAVVMALLLSPAAAACGAAVAIACFIVLTQAFVPMRQDSGEPLGAGLLAFGHWTSLALAAGVTAWFVIRIVAALREHDRLLAQAAQRALRDEAVLRVGALAAGAAHELATPLTTMAVVVGEIALHAGTPELKRDAEVLAGQIGICRETIGNMMAAAGHAGAVGGGRERLDRFLESIAARCRATRPEANIMCEWGAGLCASEIFAEQSLRQALLSLLNNAVDASPADVRFAGARQAHELRLSIADRGQGLPEGELDKLGRTFFTTKPRGQGAGLGLVLAARAVERLGGTLGWKKRPGGGMCAEVVLPWNALSLEERA
jgi:two-component system sensor histidine kinase RegB